jgi:mannose-6-phosphate isomerase-like protein (cupin superfamily)
MASLSKEWPWPDSLDAVAAAPENHVVLFENDRVRVLDTLIRPGRRTPLHTHRWAMTMYVLSWSDFVRFDEHGKVAHDTRRSPARTNASAALWSEPMAPHVLENVGTVDLRVISVELKQ